MSGSSGLLCLLLCSGSSLLGSSFGGFGSSFNGSLSGSGLLGSGGSYAISGVGHGLDNSSGNAFHSTYGFGDCGGGSDGFQLLGIRFDEVADGLDVGLSSSLVALGDELCYLLGNLVTNSLDLILVCVLDLFLK